jgi:hypothetical protein
VRLTFTVPAGLTLETDVAAAAWVDERLLPLRSHPDGVLVGEVVPTGFDAYARVLHPARRYETAELGDWMTWGEVARDRGKRIHPEVQFQALIDAALDHRQSEQGDLWMPEEGSIPLPVCASLVEVLRRHTETADRCLFCLWDGFGFLHPGSGTADLVAVQRGVRGRLQRIRMRQRARRGSKQRTAAMDHIPRVQIHPAPDRRGAFREYLLFRGPLEAVTSFFFGGASLFQSPNLWWPQDRSWVVATEIDDWTTYVGGSRACIEDLLASPRLEVVPSGTDRRFDVLGDSVNATGS